MFTVTLVVYSVKPPSLSMIRARTVYVPLSGYVQVVEGDMPLPAYVAPASEALSQA